MDVTASTEAFSDAVPLCELRNVSRDFVLPNRSRLRVVEGISLVVRTNEVIALLGPSGCGKSTVLRILAGLIRPTEGEVLYHGAPLRGLNPGARMVFQSFALLPWMTVVENVDAVLAAAGYPADVARARAEQVIGAVGLQGFEDAYPRELSGGMKQRVGMARAISLDPEILLMDEPFSQVDALTAESLRAEVLDLWAAKEGHMSSIVLVSHDITEVVTMADRIVVLGTHPGRIRAVVDNRLPRPRAPRSPEVLRLVDRLHDVITGHELPDEQAAPEGRGAAIYEPLPQATPTEIVGLLEYLDGRGGNDDIFRIASETHREFGHVIAIVRAAEMLDLVDTPRRTVLLAPLGRRFIAASPAERTSLWRAQILELAIFREVRQMLERHPEHRIERNVVLETIILRMPSENYEMVFETLVAWGRYGNLFKYDEEEQVLSLPEMDRA